MDADTEKMYGFLAQSSFTHELSVKATRGNTIAVQSLLLGSMYPRKTSERTKKRWVSEE